MMVEPVHLWEQGGRTLKFTWLGDADVPPSRVYALAFTPERRMLLVTDASWEPSGWLPGGGVESGETPLAALERELVEEANAHLQAARRIGVQQVDDSAGGTTFHAFYWCRVTLAADFRPQLEITHRYLVEPHEFLDRLFWGRTDPKAALLLELALQLEDRFTAPQRLPA
jgi:8-oxo-dGTP pyrophosphatase MutT (NUDIX family)